MLYYLLGSIGGVVTGFGLHETLFSDPSYAFMVVCGGAIWFFSAVALVLTEA